MKDYSGFPGDCSDEQLATLEKFKKEVAAKGISNPRFNDPYYLRFLRARKFDLTKSLAMFYDFVKWRGENDVDNIESYVFGEISEVKQFYPHGYFRTDKEGRPIYIERIGLLKIQNLFKVTTQDRLVKYYIQSYERLVNDILPACTKKFNKRVDQSFTILDLKGASMKMASGQVYDFIKLASGIGQNYYPEIMGKMFIINAPMLFSGVWAIIKVWLDEKTRNKIKILGTSFQKELLEHIDAENLPDFLGGKCTVADYGENLDIEQGPWLEVEKKEEVQVEEQKKEEEEAKVEDNAEDNAEDIAALKNALAGMKIGTGGHKKKPAVEEGDEDFSNFSNKNMIPSDTPLNTQIDGEED